MTDHDGPLAQAYALTLVAPQAEDGRAEDRRALGDDARETLAEAGAELLRERGLGAFASETEFHGDANRVRTLLQARYSGRTIDWCVQPAPARARRLLLCDMDSTIIGCECIDEIAAILGIKAEIAAITERAMRGELDFEAALTQRVARLKGVTETDLARVYAERVRLNPGAATLTATMRAHGARCVLVSGGFTFFTERVARAAGFDDDQGNLLLIENGALTGKVALPVLGKDAKREALVREANALGVAPEEAVAIGDGANDLAMLAVAGIGIAYRAKPVVEAQASARIATGDLRSALLFQGIAPEDFVERG